MTVTKDRDYLRIDVTGWAYAFSHEGDGIDCHVYQEEVAEFILAQQCEADSECGVLASVVVVSGTHTLNFFCRQHAAA